MTLAVAQLEPTPGRLDESVIKHARMANMAADLGAELLLFPELSLTGYSRELTHNDALDPRQVALEPLAEVSRKRGIAIVAGSPLASAAGLLISSISFLPDGRTATYSKQHLHAGEDVTFVCGRGGDLPAVGDRTVGLAICAEINHPSHVENTIARGADVYAASCFLTPTGYEGDCQRLQAYAKRHGVLVLMANLSGPCGGFESAGGSAIWDDAGQLLAVAPAVGEYLVLGARNGSGWVGSIHEGA